MTLQNMFSRLMGRETSKSGARRETASRKPSHRNKKSRGLRMESLQKRELLASDLGAISGVAFIDADGDSTVDVGEQLLQNVDVSLYLDDGTTVGEVDGGDTLVGTLTTGADGAYRFTNLDGEDTVANDDAAEDLITTPTYLTSTGLYVLSFAAGAGGVEDDLGNPIAGVVLSDDIGVQVTDDNGVTAVTIDDFTTEQPSQPLLEDGETADTLADRTTNSSSGDLGASSGVVGQERDVQIIIETGTGDNSQFRVDTTPGNQLFSIQNGLVTATTLVQYDGVDADGADITLDTTGLGGINLSDDDDQAGLRFQIFGDTDVTGGFQIRVYDQSGNSATYTHDINAGLTEDLFVPFSAFVETGTMDYTDVGAIEAFVDSVTDPTTDLDVRVSVLESQRSNEVTANGAASIPLFLGGQIFVDNGGGTDSNEQDNGVLDAGEGAYLANLNANNTGTDKVIVQLFDVDPSAGGETPIATTLVDISTDSNPGEYLFDTVGADPLGPGTYYVVIPETEFADDDSLAGYIGSSVDTPGNSGADVTNDDVDDDNDGVYVAGVGFISGAITLSIGDEPTSGNTNTTVDFGVVPTTDLRIDKTISAGDSNLIPGGTAVFTVTVENKGLNDATAVKVSDIVPDGLTITTIQDSDSNNVAFINEDSGGDTIRSFTIGDVDAGETVVYTITATVSGTITVDPINEVRVEGFEVEDDIDTVDADVATGDTLQGALANNVAIESVDISLADLTITKTDSLTTTTAGSQITYTIVVSNDAGADTANNVVALDTLPTGVTFVSGTVTVGDGTVTEITTGVDTGKIQATLGTLDPGASETFVIVVDIDADLDDANSPLTNSVTVTADNAAEQTDTDDTTVTREVDVTVGKVVVETRTPDDRTDGDDADDIIDSTSPYQVFAGGFVTYQITASNSGTSEARGVEVTDTLPAGLTYVTGSFDALASGVAAPAVSGQDLTFTIPNLAPGESQIFTFEVAVASDEFDPILNTATITTTDPESDATNNTGSVTIDPDPQIDLILDKSVGQTTVVPGSEQIVYTFVVSHDVDSISDAVNVDVTDLLPSGLSNAVISGTGITSSNFNSTTGAVLVEYASIPVGETRTFTVTADVDADVTGTIVNAAEVTVPGVTELDDTNNTDTVTVTADPEFDLTIDKSVNGTGTFGPLDTVTFTIVVSHDLNDDGTEADNGQSPSQATGVVLTDVLPTGLTFVSATAAGAATTPTSTTGGTIVFAEFDLAPGATRTYTITASVDDTAIGSLTNNASLVTDAGETETTNNSDSADVTIVPEANVRVSKTVSTTTAQTGSELTYTITVTNDGPSAAESVTAVDTLPTGVTFVSGTGPSGALTASGQTVTVNGGTLDASGTGSSFVFTIVATVNDGVTASQTNIVSVSTSTAETTTADNTASATTAIDQAINELSGTVFRDFDNDGLLNGMDSALEGIELLLTGGDLGTDGLRTVTDENGFYEFDDLIAGDYTVQRLDLPDYFNDGLEQAGTGATPADSVDSIMVSIGGTDGQSVPDNNFALVPYLSYKLCIL
ncbi:beta strand repeat-containing protein [Neorhodopirellula lusitana]|uniref:beta strand repeat-containing protein n=1 Tax=Neorhodopirellula lusitana TaxID=445327 RepID=UPI00384BC226